MSEVQLDGTSAMRQAGMTAEHYLVEAHKILTDKFTDCPSVSDAIELAKVMAQDFNTAMMAMKMQEIRDAIADLTAE